MYCKHGASTTAVNKHTHTCHCCFHTSLAWQQKQIVQRAAHNHTAGIHSIPWSLEVSLYTKLELKRTWHSLIGGICFNTMSRGTNESQEQQPTSTYSFNKACEYLLV